MQHIPVSFSRGLYLRDKSKATLTNSLNKSWEVAIITKRSIYKGTMTIYYSFSKGWKEFCYDNRLEEGDVCSFEPISEKGAAKLEMRVTFRKN